MIKEKLDKKKRYFVTMNQDVLYSIGVMAFIGTLSIENRELVALGRRAEDKFKRRMIMYRLDMNAKQRIAFEEVAKDYIYEIVDHEKEMKDQ